LDPADGPSSSKPEDDYPGKSERHFPTLARSQVRGLCSKKAAGGERIVALESASCTGRLVHSATFLMRAAKLQGETARPAATLHAAWPTLRAESSF